MILPAGFTRCERCGRLIVVDALNPTGQCSREDCEVPSQHA